MDIILFMDSQPEKGWLGQRGLFGLGSLGWQRAGYMEKGPLWQDLLHLGKEIWAILRALQTGPKLIRGLIASIN